jgi:putative transposase
MRADTVRKTFKEKLRPAPAQEQAIDALLWRCRALYNAGLAQRKTAWERCHVSVSRYEQEAELRAIRAAFPEYAAIHSHVLQDVLARLDKAYDAFFRRNRWRSFTFKEYGNGARLANGYLVLAKTGRISVHWSRPLEGTPKTVTISREAGGWYLCSSCTAVPVKPLPLTGQETDIDWERESFATRADGERIKTPRWYRTAEGHFARCQRRVARRQKGSTRRAKAVHLLAKAHQHIAHQRRDCLHQEACKLVQQYDVL